MRIDLKSDMAADTGLGRLIGHTPVPLCYPEHASPFLIRAGDLVRFVPIGRREFDVLEREMQNRAH